MIYIYYNGLFVLLLFCGNKLLVTDLYKRLFLICSARISSIFIYFIDCTIIKQFLFTVIIIS